MSIVTDENARFWAARARAHATIGLVVLAAFFGTRAAHAQTKQSESTWPAQRLNETLAPLEPNERIAADELTTLQLLEGIQLRRLSPASAECTHLYERMDGAMDALVDSALWHEVIHEFARSGIFEVEHALVHTGCDDDLSRQPNGEPRACTRLRQQGRCILAQLEHSRCAQAVLQSRSMLAWQAQLRLGRALGCLVRPPAPTR